MLERHPALRARFRHRHGQIAHEVRDLADLPVATLVLGTAVDVGGADDSLARFVQAEFDPFGSVLVRGTLLPCADGGTCLIVEAHHVLVDEESIAVAVGFLAALVTGDEGGAYTGEAGDDGTLDNYLAATAAVAGASTEASRNPASAAYWKAAFDPPPDAAPPCWPLAVEAHGGAPGRYRHPLDAGEVAALRDTARAAKVSVPILLHAALIVVLHRYGLGRRQMIGIPISLRDHPSVGFNTVGLFLNVLPVVTTVDSDDTLGDVLARVRHDLIELQDHKFAALNDIPALAGVPRSAVVSTPTASFAVTLAVHETLRPAGGTVSVEGRSRGRPGALLDIDVSTGPDGGRVTVSWQPTVLPWPSATDLVRHLLRVATVIGADKATAVGEFDLLNRDERERTTLRLNGRPDLPPQVTDRLVPVPAAVAERVRKDSSATALTDAGGSWTYADLGAAVERATATYRAQRLPFGARVGVALGRTRQQIAQALALWSAGLVYVPIDSDAPSGRAAFVAADANLALVVAVPVEPGWAELPCPVVPPLETSDSAAEPEVELPTAAGPALDDIAYVLYTSGTSGRPKGVEVTHRNLAGLFRAMQAALPAATAGGWLAETAPTFDISFLEMFWPLVNGQTVTLADPEAAGGAAFRNRQCTSTRARQLLTARQLGEPLGSWEVEPSTWLIGGETFPAGLLRELAATYPKTKFVNAYGPTEATIWSTLYPCMGGEDDDVPIGWPLENTLLAVVDDGGRPVPPGAVGELMIAGAGVAAGYLGRPELTAAAFTTVPTATGRELSAYRTGDHVVLDPEGRLRFRGRADSQVKLRGHRIELGEIEQRLLTDPAVSGAAVVLLPGSGAGEGRVVAAVTVRPNKVWDPAAARRRLAADLPEIMVPDRLVRIPELPRSASGKLDRIRIAELCVAAPSDELVVDPASTDSADEAASPELTVVTAAVAEVVGRLVRADDDFFAVGGNSLSALGLVAAVRARGVEVHVRDVFEQQTLRRIAERAVLVGNPRAAVAPATGSGPSALLPMQADFFATYDGDPNWFFTPMVMELVGRHRRLGELADRVTSVMRRYASLSARFEPAAGGWIQRLDRPATIHCEAVERPGVLGDEPARLTAVLDELRPAVDIHAGRPVVARLVGDDAGRRYLVLLCDDAGRRYLVLLCHHLAVDALSLRLLLREVAAAVTADVRQAPEPAPAALVVAGMQRLANSAAVRSERDRWRSLPFEEGCVLPLDRPAGSHREASSDDESTSLDPDETARLVRLASRMGLQVGDVVTATAAAAVLTVFDRQVAILDHAIHGRDLSVPGLTMAEAVGWIAVNVPIVLTARETEPAAAVERVRAQLVSAYGRGHGYSLSKHFSSDPEVRAELADRPRPVVSCNYIGSDGATSAWRGLRSVPVGSFVSYDPSATRSHLFDIDCAVLDGRLVVQTGYSAEAFDRATPQALMDRIAVDLRRLANR